MPVRLFVGGLAPTVTEDDLRRHFGAFGQVVSAVIVFDADARRRGDWGFVEMADEGATRAALLSLDGRELRGKCLSIVEAKPRGVRLGPRLVAQ